MIKTDAQAQELAKILVDSAIDKFKNPKGKKTPYQRKYKKTYNATWEVSTIFDYNMFVGRKRRRYHCSSVHS